MQVDSLLQQVLDGQLLSDTQALELASCVETKVLMQASATLRDQGFNQTITYSRKVFFPLTQLCRDVLEAPALADDKRYNENVLRVENKDALRFEIEAYFKRFNRAEMAAKLHQGGIAFGNINDMSDLQRHPALKRRTVETSGNKVSLVRRIGDTTERPPHVPNLDEHGPAIRAEFR